MAIHPTAIIDPSAELGSDVEVGPFCVVEGNVKIGSGCRLLSSVFITGHTEIGEGCVIHPFTAVGNEPQDIKFKGEPTYCRVGARTILREGVTIHRGTDPGSSTVIGSDCFLMVNSHVGHNCEIGDHVTIVNGVLLAGHVSVASHAIISGNSVVHQFCRLGQLTMLQGHSGVGQDIVPFAIADRWGRIAGLNLVGLRRAGISREEITALREAFQLLFGKRGNFSAVVKELTSGSPSGAVGELVAFLNADSRRGFAGGTRS